jgi:hypothetical protein
MAEWHESELEALGQLLRRVQAQNSYRLVHEIADPSSGRLLPSSPQLEVLGAVVVPLPVAMMHLLPW